MSNFRIPAISSSVVIRLADGLTEIEAASQLALKSHVSASYWEVNAKHLQNKLVDSPARKMIVALENGQLVGTISLVLDSPLGLPSDGAQAALMQQLRATGDRLAEISAFAVDSRRTANRKLALFLVGYALQYAYYYQGADRLVASCLATHASFYQSAAGFSMLSGPASHGAPIAPDFYLLSLDFNEVHSRLSDRTLQRGEAFCRFMLRDPQPCHRFPSEGPLKRSRGNSAMQQVA